LAQRRRKGRPTPQRRPAGATPVATRTRSASTASTPSPAPPTRSAAPAAHPDAPPSRPDAPRPDAPPSRSEARNAAVRATLTPLAPGERPWPLKVSALIALLIGGGDLVAVLISGKFEVGNAHAGASGVILFSVLMLVAAWGMWQLRYWAVLGFQAILVFVILYFSVLLIRAANLLAVVAGVIVVGGGGYLFFKLVRVLSRLQMPQPPAHHADR
jgi:hypothetical protein